MAVEKNRELHLKYRTDEGLVKHLVGLTSRVSKMNVVPHRITTVQHGDSEYLSTVYWENDLGKETANG